MLTHRVYNNIWVAIMVRLHSNIVAMCYMEVGGEASYLPPPRCASTLKVFLKHVKYFILSCNVC